MIVVRRVGELFAWLAQGGRGRRSMLPVGSGGGRIAAADLADKLPGKVAIGLIFVTNHRRLADVSDLQADYAITVETHELDLVRWLAVNTLFERHLRVR